MIQGKKNLLEWMKFHGYPYWKLCTDSSKVKVLAENDETADIETSISKLDNVLNLIAEGRYFISCKKTESMTKGLHETFFAHTASNISPSSNISGAGSPLTAEGIGDLVKRQVKEGIEKYKAEREVDDLKKQVEEYKKLLKEKEEGSLEKGLSKFIGTLQPYTPAILEHFGIKQAAQKTATTIAVSGTEEQTTQATEEQINELQTRLENGLKTWSDADPEFYIEMIEKIAAGAKENPDQYKMYRGMLIGK